MANTKASFLKKMNFRLKSMEKISREETVQRYREKIDERIAAGTSEAFAVTCMGDVDILCMQILEKAGCPTLRPRLCHALREVSKNLSLVLRGFLMLLLTAIIAFCGFLVFVLVRDTVLHYIPIGLFSSNILGGLFQIGMLCAVLGLCILLCVFVVLSLWGIVIQVKKCSAFIAERKATNAATIVVKRETYLNQ